MLYTLGSPKQTSAQRLANMGVIQSETPLGHGLVCVAHNPTSTMMAGVTGTSELVIFERVSNGGWVPEQGTDNKLNSLLHPGESVSELHWAHPQYGALLAVGTSHGRVLLCSCRPSHSLRPSSGTTDEGTIGVKEWVVQTVTLSQADLPRASKINALAFSPGEGCLVLACAHDDGCARLITCTTQLPMLPRAEWTCTHLLRPTPGEGKPSPLLGLSWQLDPEPSRPCLALASSRAASLWCYDRLTMDWVCVCDDLERATGHEVGQGDVSAIAWAPCVGRDKEFLAVARGTTVRVVGVSGDLRSPDVIQIGDSLKHSGPVWQMDWSIFGFELVASCEATEGRPPEAVLWRFGLEGHFGAKPVSIIRGAAPEEMDH